MKSNNVWFSYRISLLLDSCAFVGTQRKETDWFLHSITFQSHSSVIWQIYSLSSLLDGWNLFTLCREWLSVIIISINHFYGVACDFFFEWVNFNWIKLWVWWGEIFFVDIFDCMKSLMKIIISLLSIFCWGKILKLRHVKFLNWILTFFIG